MPSIERGRVQMLTSADQLTDGHRDMHSSVFCSLPLPLRRHSPHNRQLKQSWLDQLLFPTTHSLCLCVDLDGALVPATFLIRFINARLSHFSATSCTDTRSIPCSSRLSKPSNRRCTVRVGSAFPPSENETHATLHTNHTMHGPATTNRLAPLDQDDWTYHAQPVLNPPKERI
jgi:hypothetical protein